MPLGLWLLTVTASALAAGGLTWHLNRALVREWHDVPLADPTSPPPQLHLLPVGLSFVSATTLLYWLRGPTPLLLQDSLLLITLIGIAWFDLKTLLIEMRLLLLGAALQVTWLVVFAPHLLPERLLALLLGAGGLYWVGVVYETLREREGLGSGDGAVLGLLGLWTGSLGLPLIIFLAALLGTVWGGFQWVRQGPEGLHQPFPFAPFLCLAGAVVYGTEQVYDSPLREILSQLPL